MGYNLQLGCLTCRERTYVYRGQESAAIRAFADRHEDHKTIVGIDNGFAEDARLEGLPLPGWTDWDFDTSAKVNEERVTRNG